MQIGTIVRGFSHPSFSKDEQFLFRSVSRITINKAPSTLTSVPFWPINYMVTILTTQEILVMGAVVSVTIHVSSEFLLQNFEVNNVPVYILQI